MLAGCGWSKAGGSGLAGQGGAGVMAKVGRTQDCTLVNHHMLLSPSRDSKVNPLIIRSEKGLTEAETGRKELRQAYGRRQIRRVLESGDSSADVLPTGKSVISLRCRDTVS